MSNKNKMSNKTEIKTGALMSVYVKKSVLRKMLGVLDAKGDNGMEMTISAGGATNEYGQNLSMFAKQTEEQIKAKKPKFYVGNGKVFWISEGGLSLSEKQDEKDVKAKKETEDLNMDDLPF